RLVLPDPIGDDGPGTDLARRDAETIELAPAIEGVPVDADQRGDDNAAGFSWADTAGSTAGRRPIVPAWLRSATQRRAVARAMLDLAGYTVAFHSLRTPKYLAKTCWYAPRGMLRTVGR